MGGKRPAAAEGVDGTPRHPWRGACACRVGLPRPFGGRCVGAPQTKPCNACDTLTFTPALVGHLEGDVDASGPKHDPRWRNRPLCGSSAHCCLSQGRVTRCIPKVKACSSAATHATAIRHRRIARLDYRDSAAQSVRLRAADMRHLFLVLAAIAIVSVVGLSVANVVAPKPRHWTPGQAITLCGPQASRPIPSDCPTVRVETAPEVSHRPYDPRP